MIIKFRTLLRRFQSAGLDLNVLIAAKTRRNQRYRKPLYIGREHAVNNAMRNKNYYVVSNSFFRYTSSTTKRTYR